MRLWHWLAGGLAVGLLLVALLTLDAEAHDHWINRGNYKAPDGLSCCGDNDCEVVAESDVIPTLVGWLIKSLNETIPYSETLTSEDRDFWRCHRYDGSRRCFFAPDYGS